MSRGSLQEEYVVAYNAVSSLTKGAATSSQIAMVAWIMASFKLLVDHIRGDDRGFNPFDLMDRSNA